MFSFAISYPNADDLKVDPVLQARIYKKYLKDMRKMWTDTAEHHFKMGWWEDAYWCKDNIKQYDEMLDIARGLQKERLKEKLEQRKLRQSLPKAEHNLNKKKFL